MLGETLAYKLLTVTYLLNPEVIIIGGGVAAAKETLLQPIQEIFSQYYNLGQLPEICVGSLGDSAGIIGSAYLAIEKENL